MLGFAEGKWLGFVDGDNDNEGLDDVDEEGECVGLIDG